PPHRDAPSRHFPGGRGRRGGAQPPLGGPGLPSPGTQRTLAPTDRGLPLWPPYWPNQALRSGSHGWALPLGLIVPDALAHPCTLQQPALYGSRHGWRVGYLWLVADGY